MAIKTITAPLVRELVDVKLLEYGLEEARRHIGQTLLSLLGLVLGTASIVTVLALFGGQATHTRRFIEEVGGNLSYWSLAHGPGKGQVLE